MKKKGRQTKRASQGRAPIATIFMLVLCALLFASGFFLAGRQHFSSVDYGMKNSKLKKQIADLETEKRRLILAREISLSPNELRKAAKKAGLLAEPSSETQAPSAVQASVKTTESQSPSKAAPSNPLVVKTASVAELHPTAAPAMLKSTKTDRPTVKADRERTVKPADAVAAQIKRTAAAE